MKLEKSLSENISHYKVYTGGPYVHLICPIEYIGEVVLSPSPSSAPPSSSLPVTDITRQNKRNKIIHNLLAISTARTV